MLGKALKFAKIFLEKKIAKDLLIISLLFILGTVCVYGYYWFFHPLKLQYIYQNWDGPAYLVIAKTFYNSKLIPLHNTITLSASYFAAHFPLYPLFIRLFSFIGYWRSMLFVSQLFALLFIFASYFLGKKLFPKINPLIPALVLIFLPPRWFVLSRVGSSEPVYLFFITLAIYFLVSKDHLKSAIFAAIAQLARAQAILFPAGLFLYCLWQLILKKITVKQAVKQYWPFLFVPLALLFVFIIFHFQYGDFFAFFKTIKGYSHLQLPPYKVFWHYFGTMGFWKEMVVFNLVMYTAAVISLFEQKRFNLGFIALALVSPFNFLVHLDLSRYAIAALPFLFIAFYKIFSKKSLLIAVCLLLPAFVAYSIGFMNLNLSP